jgi:DeoR family fructose operon transcriptional repressor
MYAEERQREIARLVVDRGRASVADLAERYGVTAETVRRDLATLELSGALRRVHGGAVAPDALAVTEINVTERELANAAAKRAIGDTARVLVPAGASVLLDAGTTVLQVARGLGMEGRLTVVTNSVPAAAALGSHPNVDVQMVGGRIRGLTQAAVGAVAVGVLGSLHTDIAFVGTNGISAGRGLSTPDSDEAEIKRAMLGAADRVVVVADSAKFDHESLVSFGSLDQVDTLVTDAEPSAALAAALHQAQVEVVIAR